MSRKRGIAKWFDTVQRRQDESLDDETELFPKYTIVNGERYRNLADNQFSGSNDSRESKEESSRKN